MTKTPGVVRSTRTLLRRRMPAAALVTALLLVVLTTMSAPAVAVDAPEPSPLPQVNVDVGADGDEPLTSTVVTLLLFAVGALLVPLLFMMTTFTRYIIVLGLTRQALGLQNIPPTQVLVGIALVFTLFTMGPELTAVNEQALQPLLAGDIGQQQAWEAAYGPLREFMLVHTHERYLDLVISLSGDVPASAEMLPAPVLVPAFVLSEIQTALQIGFFILLPFLAIDLMTSAVLMSLGMIMLPPVFISAPIKLLVFILVDGWLQIIPAMVAGAAA